MNIGVTFPQTEMPADRDLLLRYVHGVEDAGFGHMTAYDHVLGADVSDRPDWPTGRYTVHDTFHEPLVLFGFVGALVELELMTAVLVLPQRQTALVAKQAAQVDVLTGGRLHLGVGVGWNQVEFAALDATFGDRGARLEEQVEVMRLLWTREVVTFEGRFHHIDRAGIRPLPVQRPVPVWLGGGRGAFDEGPAADRARRVLERVGRLADGWMPNILPGAELSRALAHVRSCARRAGRGDDALGIQGNVFVRRDTDDAALHRQIDAWNEVGATYVTVNAIGGGFSAEEHVELLPRIGRIARAHRSSMPRRARS